MGCVEILELEKSRLRLSRALVGYFRNVSDSYLSPSLEFIDFSSDGDIASKDFGGVENE